VLHHPMIFLPAQIVLVPGLLLSSRERMTPGVGAIF
jgi:hypothetical protein